MRRASLHPKRWYLMTWSWDSKSAVAPLILLYDETEPAGYHRNSILWEHPVSFIMIYLFFFLKHQWQTLFSKYLNAWGPMLSCKGYNWLPRLWSLITHIHCHAVRINRIMKYMPVSPHSKSCLLILTTVSVSESCGLILDTKCMSFKHWPPPPSPPLPESPFISAVPTSLRALSGRTQSHC